MFVARILPKNLLSTMVRNLLLRAATTMGKQPIIDKDALVANVPQRRYPYPQPVPHYRDLLKGQTTFGSSEIHWGSPETHSSRLNKTEAAAFKNDFVISHKQELECNYKRHLQAIAQLLVEIQEHFANGQDPTKLREELYKQNMSALDMNAQMRKLGLLKPETKSVYQKPVILAIPFLVQDYNPGDGPDALDQILGFISHDSINKEESVQWVFLSVEDFQRAKASFEAKTIENAGFKNLSEPFEPGGVFQKYLYGENKDQPVTLEDCYKLEEFEKTGIGDLSSLQVTIYLSHFRAYHAMREQINHPVYLRDLKNPLIYFCSHLEAGAKDVNGLSAQALVQKLLNNGVKNVHLFFTGCEAIQAHRLHHFYPTAIDASAEPDGPEMSFVDRFFIAARADGWNCDISGCPGSRLRNPYKASEDGRVYHRQLVFPEGHGEPGHSRHFPKPPQIVFSRDVMRTYYEEHLLELAAFYGLPTKSASE